MEKKDLPIINSTESNNLMQLPPGFRFHPTDEELITHYLSNKFLDSRFKSRAIGEANLNKTEPWDLPKQAKQGDNEWYFFCARDRKYPTGLRTNRATQAGYWKATGKDKEICRDKLLVGMKKTLVFYTGRAPRGEKTDWVMHEYRMEGNCCINTLHKLAKNEWVICRVFKKSRIGLIGDGFGMGKIASFSSFSCGEDVEGFSVAKNLPPLMDIPTHVPCFSNGMEGQKAPEENMSSVLWPICSTLYEGNFMSFFESHGFEEKQDKEILSFSEETGLCNEISAQIYCDNEIGRNSFDYCHWDC